jgi:hypothetical protein
LPEYVAVTGYVPALRVFDVLQLAAPLATVVAVHKVLPLEAKVVVPVAPVGRPLTDRVTALPWDVEAGVASAFIDVGIFVITKLVAVASLASLPEYSATTSYVPGISDAAVTQLAPPFETVAVQKLPPYASVKITFPVAAAASPLADNVTAWPKVAEDGVAIAVKPTNWVTIFEIDSPNLESPL